MNLKPVCRIIAISFVFGLGACASLPDNTNRPESHVFDDTQNTALGRSYDRVSEGRTGESAFYLLNDGPGREMGAPRAPGGLRHAAGRCALGGDAQGPALGLFKNPKAN